MNERATFYSQILKYFEINSLDMKLNFQFEIFKFATLIQFQNFAAAVSAIYKNFMNLSVEPCERMLTYQIFNVYLAFPGKNS